MVINKLQLTPYVKNKNNKLRVLQRNHISMDFVEKKF